MTFFTQSLKTVIRRKATATFGQKRADSDRQEMQRGFWGTVKVLFLNQVVEIECVHLEIIEQL